MDDSAFGLHLARQTDPRDVGLYFYASSGSPRSRRSARTLSGYCRTVNEAFRLTQRSADVSAIEFEFVGLPRYALLGNMEYVVAGIRTALRTISGRKLVPAKVAFAHNRNSGRAGIRAVPGRLPGRVWRAEHRVPDDLSRCSPPFR